MSNLISPPQTMNSLEIANLVQSKHSSVKRTIERLADQEIIQLSPLVKVENPNSSSNNKTTNVYTFTGEQGKLDSITVVAQLCPQFTAKLVKRWQQLEHLISSSDYEKTLEQNQALKKELIKARPTYADIIRYKEKGLSSSEIGKLIGRSACTVNTYVRTMNKLGYGVSHNPQPYQLAHGYFKRSRKRLYSHLSYSIFASIGKISRK